MIAFDPRLTPARPDLAAAHLRGKVEAPDYVEGRPARIREGVAGLRRAPNFEASLDTQALFGEEATLYEDEEGWGWIQLTRDGYVGYVSMNALDMNSLDMNALDESRAAPTHRVRVNQSFVYPCPDMKLPILDALPLGAAVRVIDAGGGFARIAEANYVYAEHLAPLETSEPDFVATAERFLHAPYLWGGKTSFGVDCSGLVQISLQAAGISAPRDTDLQEKALGVPLDLSGASTSLRRGDIVFWPGHVGLMRNETELLHANAHHMLVASEPLAAARERIAAAGAQITSIRRLKSPDADL
ncbi:NlpC/P60 family protein [Methylocapsa palsarum]|uniref:NlpC/P60 family protein n=1 Tax=Methylocapsa palsarum TaxID=1612308 RepID=A0A1I3Z1Y3_9HYPH|nr:NlpC/P60 family protein [Methylocapsa palsarum]SFK38093.1 NlpC/P60 family protein [Methylocapsa palsarum]